MSGWKSSAKSYRVVTRSGREYWKSRKKVKDGLWQNARSAFIVEGRASAQPQEEASSDSVDEATMRGFTSISANYLHRAPRGRGGFSLIDLLVSISVMVILMAILMPALGMAHELARRIGCASNLHQMGLAMQAYTSDNRDHLPPSYYSDEPPMQEMGRNPNSRASSSNAFALPGEQGSDTMFLRYRSPNPATSVPLWDGLGILEAEQYLDHPGVFYCPSHHGDHHYTVYAREWIDGRGTIAGNYQYRVPAGSSYLADLEPMKPIVADGLRTQADYNHVDGNNFLRANLSVGWFYDTLGQVFDSLPETVTMQHTGPTRRSPWEPFDDTR